MPELTGRELDAALAKKVFLREVRRPQQWMLKWREHPTVGGWSGVPSFHNDLNSVRIAELEMQRRGLMGAYRRHLGAECMKKQIPDIFMADAETRCMAMLAALSEAAK